MWATFVRSRVRSVVAGNWLNAATTVCVQKKRNRQRSAHLPVASRVAPSSIPIVVASGCSCIFPISVTFMIVVSST